MLSDLTQVNRFDQRRSPSLTSGLIFHHLDSLRTQTKGDRRSGTSREIAWRSDKEGAIAKLDLQQLVSIRNLTSQKITFPDKLRDEPVARVPIDFRRCADLEQFAGVQDGDSSRR